MANDKNKCHMVGASAALLVLIACSDKPEQPRPEPAPPAAPAAPEAKAAPTPTVTPKPAEAPSMALPAIPDGAKVFFIDPVEGATIQGALVDGKVAVPVKMGAENIAVKAAGQIESGSGHHHIIIDAASDPAGTVVAKDEQHQHYGKGETEATLTLTPGEHTLHLQFADGIHRSYGPQLQHTVKVVVAQGLPNTPSARAAAAEKSRDTDALSQAAKVQAEKNANDGKKKPQYDPPPASGGPVGHNATAQGHGP